MMNDLLNFQSTHFRIYNDLDTSYFCVMHGVTVIVLHGLPGSGKSSLAQRLIHLLNESQVLACGDLIRAESQMPTHSGQLFADCLANGKLAPDSLINQLVLNRLHTGILSKCVILDGFPRTPIQAVALREYLNRNSYPSPIVLDLCLTDETAFNRILQRRSCPKCGAIYNLQSSIPSVGDRCDYDGQMLNKRPDEDGERLFKRMAVYAQAYQTLSLHYVVENWQVFAVDASKPFESVVATAISFLEGAAIFEAMPTHFKKIEPHT
jgi:adenylate kinase